MTLIMVIYISANPIVFNNMYKKQLVCNIIKLKVMRV